MSILNQLRHPPGDEPPPGGEGIAAWVAWDGGPEVGVGDQGRVYFPASAVGAADDDVTFAALADDIVFGAVAGRPYFPSTWLVQAYPEHAARLARLAEASRERAAAWLAARGEGAK